MLVVDEEKVNKILKNKNINKSLEYLEMKVGTPLIKDNQLFYVIGGNKNNQLKTLLVGSYAHSGAAAGFSHLTSRYDVTVGDSSFAFRSVSPFLQVEQNK